MPRFYCPVELLPGSELDLPAGAARHVQVLRLQPGDRITLFHGGLEEAAADTGGEFEATILRMGRSEVQVRVETHYAIEREAPHAMHLLAGITANERMDWLIEKATELGVASITPLLAERSVLKLKGERAEKKLTHWQAVAVAACEQCGRNQVPRIHPAQTLVDWLGQHPNSPTTGQRLVLSLRAGSQPLPTLAQGTGPWWFLSGPEGGLSSTEENLALQHNFTPTSLGPRVLRAETAPLAALAVLGGGKS